MTASAMHSVQRSGRPTAQSTPAPGGSVPASGGRGDPPRVATIGIEEPRLSAIVAASRHLGLEVHQVHHTDDLRPARVVLAGGEAAALPELVASMRETGRPVAVLLPRSGVNRAELTACGAARLIPPQSEAHVIAGELATLEAAWRERAGRVLVIHDDPETLDEIRSLLAPEGLEVVSGEEADLDRLLEAERPDLLILDADLPGRDAIDLCRGLRAGERWRRLPVLLMTATDELGAITALFDAGADDYLPKPLAGPELVARVRNRIEQVEALRSAPRVDPNTGLLWRSACLTALEDLRATADRLGEPLAIAVVRLQGARRLVSARGAAAADAAVRQAGEALLSALGPEGIVGDFEGGILVGALGLGDHDARAAVASALERMRAEGPGGVALPVRLAAGIAEYPRDGSTIEDVRQAAGSAAVSAIDRGGDRVASATDSLSRGATVDVALVDADAEFAEPVLQALRTRGYAARWIADGEEAVRQLAGPHAALRARAVLLSWELPGRDGLMVLRTLAETGGLGSDTRVLIMVASRYTNGETLRALELGAHDHLTKPVPTAELMRKVQLLLGR